MRQAQFFGWIRDLSVPAWEVSGSLAGTIM